MCLCPRKLESGIKVRCNNCLECVKQYQDAWMIRLAEESKDWKYMFFLTLTYDNAHIKRVSIYDALSLYGGDFSVSLDDLSRQLDAKVVKGKHYFKCYHDSRECYDYLRFDSIDYDTKVPYLDYDDFRSYSKMVRTDYKRRFGENLDFKYFAAGEYGSQTFRPHIHLMLFMNEWIKDGVNLIDEIFIRNWRNGNVDWERQPLAGSRGLNGDMCAVCRYIAKYCSKPNFISNPYVDMIGIPPEFHLCSNGIGGSLRSLYKKRVNETIEFYAMRGELYKDGLKSFYGFNPEALRDIYNLSFISFQNKHGDVVSYRLPRYVLDFLFPRTSYTYTPVFVSDLHKAKYKRSFASSLSLLEAAIKAYSCVVTGYNSCRDIIDSLDNRTDFIRYSDSFSRLMVLRSAEMVQQRHDKVFSTLFKYYRDSGYKSPY